MRCSTRRSWAKRIDLPMSSAAYEQEAAGAHHQSTIEKKVVELKNEDFTQSFNR